MAVKRKALTADYKTFRDCLANAAHHSTLTTLELYDDNSRSLTPLGESFANAKDERQFAAELPALLTKEFPDIITSLVAIAEPTNRKQLAKEINEEHGGYSRLLF